MKFLYQSVDQGGKKDVDSLARLTHGSTLRYKGTGHCFLVFKSFRIGCKMGLRFLISDLGFHSEESKDNDMKFTIAQGSIATILPCAIQIFRNLENEFDETLILYLNTLSFFI